MAMISPTDGQESAGEQLALFNPAAYRAGSFTRQMAKAKSADAGRQIIAAFEEAFAEFERSLGFNPLVGLGGSGLGMRGFSTLSKSERRDLVRRAGRKGFGKEMQAFLADGDAMEAPFEKLLQDEYRRWGLDD